MHTNIAFVICQVISYLPFRSEKDLLDPEKRKSKGKLEGYEEQVCIVLHSLTHLGF